MAQLQKGTDYTTGDQVTAANLDAHIDNAILLPGAITDQIPAGPVSGSDTVLINQVGALKKATLLQIASAVDLSPFLRKSGGTMTGSLILSGDPSLDFQAATKSYVDSQDNNLYASVVAGLALCVAKAGDTMTGPLTLPGNPVNALHAAPRQFVEQYVASSALSGSIVKISKFTEFNYISTTSIIPFDDTIPQNTEGLPIFSAFIAPSSSSNLIRVRVSLYCSSPSGSSTCVFAVFRGTNANAIFATSEYFDTALETKQIQFEFFDSPATTSSTQYSIRVGVASASNTISINGTNSRRLGGAGQCTIVLEEIKA
jgi:hypothetical protein